MWNLNREQEACLAEVNAYQARDHARMRNLGQRFEVRHSDLPAPWEVYDLLLHRPAAGPFYTRGEAEEARRIWEVDFRALYREQSEYRRRVWAARRYDWQPVLVGGGV
jgi:hypothetical protein